MTKQGSRNSAYGLLKYISRQPLPVSRWMARMLAFIVNSFKVTKTSEVIRLNLEISLSDLPDQEREQINRAAVRNELMSYFEFFTIWGSSNQKNIKRIHRVIGEDLLHDALAQNKGLVLIVPHFGTWEIMNAYVAQFTSMTIMYKPVKNQAADQFVRAARSREKAHLVPTDESGVRQIFKALKQGGTTVILPDHTPNIGGEYIPYFGVPLATSNLSAKLIQKTKARALFLYALRNTDDGFDIFIETVDEKIYSGNANQGTQVIINSIENLIRRHPEHYHWSYKRFNAHQDLGNLYKLEHEQALSKVNALRTQDTDAHEASSVIESFT